MFYGVIVPCGLIIIGMVILYCAFTFTVEEKQPKGDKRIRLLGAFLGLIPGFGPTISSFFIYFGVILLVVGLAILLHQGPF